MAGTTAGVQQHRLLGHDLELPRGLGSWSLQPWPAGKGGWLWSQAVWTLSTINSGVDGSVSSCLCISCTPAADIET